jgi:hypothetical protein
MKQVVGALLVVVGVAAAHPIPDSPARGVSEPQTLYWERNGQPNTGTAVGLLYLPEVLAALAAQVPPDTVPATIAAALLERTPIVAMWEVSGPPEVTGKPPYTVAIVNADGGSAVFIQPIWIQQQGGDLARLDHRLTSPGKSVAAIAAFPAAAFVTGRRVLISSSDQLRADGMHTRSQRWGVIRWDGAMALR